MIETEDLARWLDRARKGEEQAYRELYRCYRPLVVRLASGFASLDRDEVEDVVQESFVRAFRALPKLRETAAFEPWLLSIARNRALSLLEQKAGASRARDLYWQETEHSIPSLPPAMQLERDAELVRRLIDELPDGPEKETVTLFYVEGQLTAREIAEKLGIGKSGVTMRLERFRQRVKDELLRRLLAQRLE